MMQTKDPHAFTNQHEIGSPCREDFSLSLEPGHTIPLDVWHRVKKHDGTEDGTCKRIRMRTLGEVFKDLDDALDFLLCDKCGHERKRRKRTIKNGADYGGDKCKFEDEGLFPGNERCPTCAGSKPCSGEYTSFIDEYFSGPDKPNELVPHDHRWIACYPVTGGSEGHYVHVDFMVPVQEVQTLDGATEYALDGCGRKPLVVTPVMGQNIWRPVRLALGKTFRGMDHAAEIAKRCAVLLGA